MSKRTMGLIFVLFLSCILCAKGKCEGSVVDIRDGLIQQAKTANVPGLSIQYVEQRVDSAERLIENKNLANSSTNSLIDTAGNITINVADGVTLNLNDLLITTPGNMIIQGGFGITADNSTITVAGLLEISSSPCETGLVSFAPDNITASIVLLNVGTITITDTALVNWYDFGVTQNDTINSVQLSTDILLAGETIDAPLSVVNNDLLQEGAISIVESGAPVNFISSDNSIINWTTNNISIDTGISQAAGSSGCTFISQATVKSMKPSNNIWNGEADAWFRFVMDRVEKQRGTLKDLFDIDKESID